MHSSQKPTTPTRPERTPKTPARRAAAGSPPLTALPRASASKVTKRVRAAAAGKSHTAVTAGLVGGRARGRARAQSVPAQEPVIRRVVAEPIQESVT
jgi:hypothetical protein